MACIVLEFRKLSAAPGSEHSATWQTAGVRAGGVRDVLGIFAGTLSVQGALPRRRRCYTSARLVGFLGGGILPKYNGGG